MAKFIRVNLPVDSPDGTTNLCDDIIEQHTALGAASPLTGFVDMAVFATKNTNAKALRKTGVKRGKTQQKKYEAAEEKCGLAKGQTKNTKDTVYWYVQKARNVLMGKFKGTEEALSEFGFNVVVTQTGARRNVRIDMPTDKPEDMVLLAEAIIEEHTDLGAASPLVGNVDMTAFETLTTDTRQLLNEWEDAKNEAQSKLNEALGIIGYAEGQTSSTAGTLYFDICSVRDRLLDVHQGNEEALSEYGFDVVVSQALTGRKKGGSSTTILVQEGDLAPGFITQVDLSGVAGMTIDTFTFEAMASAMRYFASSSVNVPPGPGQPFLDVPAGSNVVKTLGQVVSELGFNETNNTLKVNNVGGFPGHWKVSVKAQ